MNITIKITPPDGKWSTACELIQAITETNLGSELNFIVEDYSARVQAKSPQTTSCMGARFKITRTARPFISQVTCHECPRKFLDHTRSPRTLRQQAVEAANPKPFYEAIPSTGDKYEIDRRGNVRNDASKRLLKPTGRYGTCVELHLGKRFYVQRGIAAPVTYFENAPTRVQWGSDSLSGLARRQKKLDATLAAKRKGGNNHE